MIDILYEALSGALYVMFVCLVLCGIVGALGMLNEPVGRPKPYKPKEVPDPYKDIKPAVDYLLAREWEKTPTVKATPEKIKIGSKATARDVLSISVEVEKAETQEEYIIPDRVILDDEQRQEIRNLLKLLNKEEAVGRPADKDKNLVKRQIPRK